MCITTCKIQYAIINLYFESKTIIYSSFQQKIDKGENYLLTIEMKNIFKEPLKWR